MPGTSCPIRSALRTSAIRSSSIQVWWPCRRPCGVKPVSTGSHEASARSAAGNSPDPSQRPAPALCAMTLPSSRRGHARPQTAHRPVCGVADQADDTPAGRRLECVAWHGRRPWRHRPTRERRGRVHQDRHRWPLCRGPDMSRQQRAGRTVRCSWNGGSGPGPGPGTHSGRPGTTASRCSGRCSLRRCPRRAGARACSARNGGRSAGRIEPSLGRPR